jgi:hypothetical protein
LSLNLYNYTEYNQHEIEGKDLGFMHGDLTDPLLIEQVNDDPNNYDIEVTIIAIFIP